VKTPTEVYALLTDADPVTDTDRLDTSALTARIETELGYTVAPLGGAPTKIEPTTVAHRHTGFETPTPTPPPRRRWLRGPFAAVGTATVILAVVLGIVSVTGILDTGPDVAGTGPESVEALGPITLTPAPDVDPLSVSTVVGDLEFTTLQLPEGPGFGELTATPYGLVAKHSGSGLYWSIDGETWEGIIVMADSWRLTVAGDDVIVHGRSGAARYGWDGTGWTEQEELDLPGLVDQIVFGTQGAVAVKGTTFFYSPDGVRFTEAQQAPAPDMLVAEESSTTSGLGYFDPDCPSPGSESIGPVLATEAGFVAFVSARFGDRGPWVVCETLLWFSADGNTWELLSQESPFAEAAEVGSPGNIAEREGRFVAFDPGAVWVSDDGLTWERVDLDLTYAETVAGGALGWVLTGFVELGFTHSRQMWFSTDGLTWDGPHDLPDGLATGFPGYFPPQLAVGSDTIFGIGGSDDVVPVVGRLQDRGG
jgi:hypothetical protein